MDDEKTEPIKQLQHNNGGREKKKRELINLIQSN